MGAVRAGGIPDGNDRWLQRNVRGTFDHHKPNTPTTKTMHQTGMYKEILVQGEIGTKRHPIERLESEEVI
jgi:hypothetical protein